MEAQVALTAEILRRHWGLAVALGLLVLVAVSVGTAIYRRSSRGQLRATVRDLRAARRLGARARNAVSTAERRLKRLHSRADSVKPRVISEAREALEDARALEKIAGDRVLIAANHVRRVIVEEYPPSRHDALRRKYLPDDKPDGKPFTF